MDNQPKKGVNKKVKKFYIVGEKVLHSVGNAFNSSYTNSLYERYYKRQRVL